MGAIYIRYCLKLRLDAIERSMLLLQSLDSSKQCLCARTIFRITSLQNRFPKPLTYHSSLQTYATDHLSRILNVGLLNGHSTISHVYYVYYNTKRVIEKALE